MGPMHPYDLILWLTSVGLNLILITVLLFKKKTIKRLSTELEKAASALREYYPYKVRYEKLQGKDNPSVTIFRQHKEIGDLKAENTALKNGQTVSSQELGKLGFKK